MHRKRSWGQRKGRPDDPPCGTSPSILERQHKLTYVARRNKLKHITTACPEQPHITKKGIIMHAEIEGGERGRGVVHTRVRQNTWITKGKDCRQLPSQVDRHYTLAYLKDSVHLTLIHATPLHHISLCSRFYTPVTCAFIYSRYVVGPLTG